MIWKGAGFLLATLGAAMALVIAPKMDPKEGGPVAGVGVVFVIAGLVMMRGGGRGPGDSDSHTWR